jgi:predicted RND superfamily exporter protein
MNKLTDWLITHRKLVIIFVLLATILFGYFAVNISLNTDFATYLSDDDPLVQEFKRIGDVFDSNYIGMIIFKPDKGEELFTSSNLEDIDRLTERYKKFEGINSVVSLTNVPDIKKIDGGFSVGEMLEGNIPQKGKELNKFKTRILSKEMYRGTLISEDGNSTLLMVSFDSKADHMKIAGKLINRTKEIVGLTENYYFGGMPFVMYSMSEGIINNLIYLVPLILIFLLGVLYIGFRKLSGLVFPLIVVLISSIWTLGILSIVGIPLDMLTGIMPVILIAMGSADGIHIMRRYFEARGEGLDNNQAIKTTLSEMAVPVIFTSLTTIVGFISLIISNFTIIRNFGIATSIGIFIALLISIFVLPALASLLKESSDKNVAFQNTGNSALMAKTSNFIYHHQKSILIATIIFVVVAVSGIPMIVTNVDWSLCLAQGSKPYQAEMILRDKFGGSLPLQISVQGDIKDPAVLKRIRQIEIYANSRGLIENTSSIATMLSEMNYIMNGRYKVPETSQGIANLWFLLGDNKMVDQIVDSNQREALVQGRIGTMATADMQTASRQVKSYLKNMDSNLVLIDKNILNKKGKETLNTIQLQRVAERLALQLSEYKLTKDQITSSLMQSRKQFKLDTFESSLKIFVSDYLTGDSSEIKVNNKSLANRIADKLLAKMDYFSVEAIPDIKSINKIVKSEINTNNPDDLYWLSDSLVYKLKNKVKEIKVNYLWNQLVNDTHLEQSRLLTKKVKGSLWLLEEQRVAISKKTYDKNINLFASGKLRENKAELQLTGMVPVLNQMEKELLPTQIKSVGITLLVVILILIIIFKSVKIGLAGIVPTILTILTNFAILGYFGIGLDSFTALIASVVIGLGIDYTIHFVSRFKQELKNKQNDLAALTKTLQTTGVAIIINALSVGLGFEVLVLAAGQHVSLLGGLLGLALIVSAVFTLTVLPVLLLIIKPGFILNTGEKNKEVSQ